LLREGGYVMGKFAGKRVVRSERIRLEGQAARVFRLFEPEGEKQWSPGWDYEVVYAEGSVAEQGAVFLTRRAGEADAVWVVKEHNIDAGLIGYVVLRPESRVTEIEIVVKDEGNGSSSAQVTYRHTGLNEEGNRYVEGVTEEWYWDYMRHWEEAINHFLRTGLALGGH
jgi:hypothetical protein